VLIEHRGAVPEIDPTAYIAPTAVICGAVRIGPGARVLFGAVLTAERMSRQSAWFAAHQGDRVLDSSDGQ